MIVVAMEIDAWELVGDGRLRENEQGVGDSWGTRQLRIEE